MRDPNRFARICEKLRIIWTLQPAQRLGQLIENLSGRPTITGAGWQTYPPDLWNIYDEEWEQRLDRRILEFDSGIEMANGVVLFRDRGELVTKDQLYED